MRKIIIAFVCLWASTASADWIFLTDDDIGAAFGGSSVHEQPYVGTVAGLPAPATEGRLAIVNDAATVRTCTSGGGAFLVFCMDNGTTWEPTTIISGLVDADMANDALSPDKILLDVIDDGFLDVTSGGTGAGTFTFGGILLGNSTSDFAVTGVLAEGVMIVGDGIDFPKTVLIAGDISIPSTGLATVDSVQADAIAAVTEIDTGIKRAGDDDDLFLLTTNVGLPTTDSCMYMDSTGTVLITLDTACGSGGGGADKLGPDGNKGDITVGGTGTTLFINVNAVDDLALGPDSVGASEIKTGAVTNLEIFDGTITDTDMNLSDNFAWLGQHGFQGGIEIENGTSPPACVEGELFMDTDATPGQRLMGCETTTFQVQGDGSAATVCSAAGDVLMGDGSCAPREPAWKVFNTLFPPADSSVLPMIGGALIEGLDDTDIGLQRIDGVNGDGGAASHDGAAAQAGTPNGALNKTRWQDAIDWACANDYDEVHIPKGQYRVGDIFSGDFKAGVVLSAEDCPDGLVLSGAGMGKTILLTHFAGGGAMIYMADSVHSVPRITHTHGVNWAGKYIVQGAHTEGKVTAISTASPAVVTFDGTGSLLVEDELVRVRNCTGSIGINGKILRVRNVQTNSFELWDPVGFEVDGSTIGTWTGGPRACIITPHRPDLAFVFRDFTIQDDDPYSAIVWDHIKDNTGEANRTGDVYALGSHGFVDDEGPVTLILEGGAALPGNLSEATEYWITVAANDISFAASFQGAIIDLSTGSPSGNFDIRQPDTLVARSEETHGIISGPTGGFVHIDAVEFIHMGDEPIEVFAQGLRVLIENIVCNGGLGHCITVNGLMDGVIRNNYMFKDTRYTSLLQGVSDEFYFQGAGGGAAIDVEAFGSNREVRNLQIYNNIVEGDWGSCIVMVTSEDFDIPGGGINGVNIYGNKCNLDLRPGYCDESGETCGSITIKQRGGRIRNVHIYDNYIQGQIAISSSGSEAERLSGILVENNVIRPFPRILDQHGITVYATEVIIRGNDIRDFGRSCVSIQPEHEAPQTVTSFDFDFSDIDTADDFLLAAGNPFVDGNGPFRLITDDTLPGGLFVDTDYFLLISFETPDEIQFSLTPGGSARNLTTQGAGTHTLLGAYVDAFTFEPGDVEWDDALGPPDRDYITLLDNPFRDRDGPVRLLGGDLPLGLNTGTDYYLIIDPDAPDVIEFSLVRGGAVEAITDAGTGLHTIDMAHAVTKLDVIDNYMECGGKSTSGAFFAMIGRIANSGAGRAAYAENDYYNIIGNTLVYTEASLGTRFILIDNHRSNVRIEDNVIKMHESRTGGLDAMFLNGTDGLRVINNRITGPIRGLFVGGNQSAKDVLIEGNVFTGQGFSGLPVRGIEINNARNVTIRGNRITDYTANAIRYVNTLATNGNMTGFTVTDNIFKSTAGMDFLCSGSCSGQAYTDVVISRNSFDSTGRTNFQGIIELDNVIGAIVRDNYIKLEDGGAGEALLTTGITDDVSVFDNIAIGPGDFVFGSTAANGDASCDSSGVGANSICGRNVTDASPRTNLRLHAHNDAAEHSGELDNANMEDMAANTVMLKEAGAGARTAQRISLLTDHDTPVAGDFFMVERASDALLVRVDFDDLGVGGGSGDEVLINGTNVIDSLGIDLLGGDSITIVHDPGPAPETATFDCDDATTSLKGCASFNSSHFAVSSGDVTVSATHGDGTAHHLQVVIPGSGLNITGGNSIALDLFPDSGNATLEEVAGGMRVKEGNGIGNASAGLFVVENEVNHNALSNGTGSQHVTWDNSNGSENLHISRFPNQYRDQQTCVYVTDPVADEDLESVFRVPTAGGAVEMWCEVRGGTSVKFDFAIGTTSPSAMYGSEITCVVAEGLLQNNFAGTTAMAEDDRLDINIGAIVGDVDSVTFCLKWRINDS